MSQIPDLSGRVLGEYELLKRVGVGGMGEVYEGRHPLIGKRVAVKVLLPSLSNEKELVERFLSEARAVNEIRHRGIVDIFSFGQLPEGARYFVMEFLEGEAFDKIIKHRAPLPIAEALSWADEMLDALDAAHAAGIIHRDIKPSNLFLVNTGRGRPYVKLLDFGIAKLGALPGEATPQTRASVILGTPDYISPEQARGKPISPQTDLYALGCVIFEMVTGQRVFRGENTLQTMWSHVEDEPPVPSSLRADIPKELDDVILWALNKEASDRPPSAAVMRDRLAAIRASLGPAVTPPPITGGQRPISVTPAPRSGSQAPVKTPGPSSRSGGQAPISQRNKLQPQGAVQGSSETRVAPMTGLEATYVPGSQNQAGRVTDPEVPITPPPKSKLPFVLAGVVGVLILGVIALVAFDNKPSADPVVPEPEKIAKVDPPPKNDPPPKVEPAKVEPAKVEPAKVEPAKVEPAKVEPAKVEPAKVEPAKVEPAKVEPAKVEPEKVEPAKPKGKVISHEMLVARLKKIEAQLAARESETGQKDNVLRQFVEQAKKDIKAANTDGDRKEVWGFLGDIEGQLKR